MIVAVASGKGGTGKTTVAVNLAMCFPGPVRLLDCDVEEPNCDIFLQPRIQRRERVRLPFAVVNEALCNGCGECSKACQYNAIVSLKTKPLVFPSLCHGCGGCVDVCPVGAIAEGEREIGTVDTGISRGLEFVQGCLDVGQALSPPVIRAVRERSAFGGTTIIDSPPGTSCPVVAAVKGSDYVVLVAESTPFGLHDLTLAVATMRRLDLRFGVVVNRAAGDRRVADYCRDERIPILVEIPEDRKAAEACSRGELLVEAAPGFRALFERLAAGIVQELQYGKGAPSDQRGRCMGIA